MDFISARRNMVDSQVRTSDVTDPALIQAMASVERERFCAPSRAFAAYAEVECEIAPGRVLMTPRDLAKLLQAARPRAGERALALAAPYAAALLAQLGLEVQAQEPDAQAAAVVEEALADHGIRQEVAPLTQPVADDLDLIVCEGAVAEVPPAWLAALKTGGRLVVVERSGPTGRGVLIVKTGEDSLSRKPLFDSAARWLEGFAPQPIFQL